MNRNIKLDSMPIENVFTIALRNNKLIDVSQELSISEPNLNIQRKPTLKIWVSNIGSGNPLLKEMLKAVCKEDENLLNAQIRFDNNPVKKVSDFIKNDINTKILYHGTSDILLKDIFLKGLTFGNKSHNYTSASKPSLKDRVYLCNEYGLGAAKFAANSACNKHGGNPAYIAINIEDLELDKLVADEDSNEIEWKKSLDIIGCVAYKGNIEPNLINIAYEDFLPKTNCTYAVNNIIRNRESKSNNRLIKP